ncbi:hypothetical protein BASA62_008291 [Batrachochytrium salamandrivorans]|nr:hypothetical protein BASA62_008291 [Batrachochytrium salamandrivorans]
MTAPTKRTSSQSSAGRKPSGLGDIAIPGLSLTLKEVNWVHLVVLSATPLISLVAFFLVPMQFNTMAFAFFWYMLTGFGITVGYHRYWSHRSYEATIPYQIVLALAGAGAVQGSIRWWSRGHRAHHRYTDTPKDPYNARKGIFWSHLGWLLVKTDYSTVGRVDITDLNSDPIVMWQHRNYVAIVLLMSVVLPTAIPGLLWGDWLGGYFYAAIARLVLCIMPPFVSTHSLIIWARRLTMTAIPLVTTLLLPSSPLVKATTTFTTNSLRTTATP